MIFELHIWFTTGEYGITHCYIKKGKNCYFFYNAKNKVLCYYDLHKKEHVTLEKVRQFRLYLMD